MMQIQSAVADTGNSEQPFLAQIIYGRTVREEWPAASREIAQQEADARLHEIAASMGLEVQDDKKPARARRKKNGDTAASPTPGLTTPPSAPRVTGLSPLTPRLVDETTAAAYLGRSRSAFRSQLAEGKLPAPSDRNGRIPLWDVRVLDNYVDALSSLSGEVDTWADLDACLASERNGTIRR